LFDRYYKLIIDEKQYNNQLRTTEGCKEFFMPVKKQMILAQDVFSIPEEFF
jgi:hypothetical protein